MDIRQLVMVSEKRNPIVNELCGLFNIEVAFNDPGVAHFGLENAVLPLGTDFLEVVSPVEEGTTAGRYLEKQNGNSGYMVIIQVNNFEEYQDRVRNKKIRVVHESNFDEAKAIHLHPKQMGGAILSLDWMNPFESWKWAGPNWEKHVNTSLVKGLKGVQIESKDPKKMMEIWNSVLDATEGSDFPNRLILDNTWVDFVPSGEGTEKVSCFALEVENKKLIEDRAIEMNLLVDGNITIGGVKFLLS